MRVRRDRLSALLAEKGAQRRLAELLDVLPAYVSQLVKGRRGMGEQVARRIESVLNLPERYLDGREDGITPSDLAHLDLYRAAPEAVRAAVDTMLRAAAGAAAEPVSQGADRPTEQEPGLDPCDDCPAPHTERCQICGLERLMRRRSIGGR